MKSREVWEKFAQMALHADDCGADGHVPIALVTLPVVAAADDRVDMDGEVRILWPNEIPHEERKRLLNRLARAMGALGG